MNQRQIRTDYQDGKLSYDLAVALLMLQCGLPMQIAKDYLGEF